LLKVNEEEIMAVFFPLYHEEDLAGAIIALEHRSSHYRDLAQIMGYVAALEASKRSGSLYVAELGGGAHPEHYTHLWRVLEGLESGSVDWVDMSVYMLNHAKETFPQPLVESVRFIPCDMMSYLQQIGDHALDMVLMKYTFNFLPPTVLESFFALLRQKLFRTGRLVATISVENGILPSRSQHVRYVHQGEEVPVGESRVLSEGEEYGVKFFANPDDPARGYVGEIQLYYHSLGKLKSMAEKYGFDYFFGDWRALADNIPPDLSARSACFMILRQKNK
jgi:hypothetical protein